LQVFLLNPELPGALFNLDFLLIFFATPELALLSFLAPPRAVVYDDGRP
jgi:hypothetical protein